MLRVIPKTWCYTFSVTDGTKSIAQSVELSWWRDKSALRIQDDIYTARRDKSWYFLESEAGVLARAERPRKWFRELVIEHSGRRYTLRAKSAFRRQFLLLEGSTQSEPLLPKGSSRAGPEWSFEGFPAVPASLHHLVGDDALEAAGLLRCRMTLHVLVSFIGNNPQVVFSLTFSAGMVARSVALACLVRLLGRVFPAVRAARLPIAATLRADR